MCFLRLADRLDCLARVAPAKLTLYHGTDTEWKGFQSDSQESGYYPGFHTSLQSDIPQGFGKNVIKFTGNLHVYKLRSADELKEEAARSGFGRTSGSGDAEVRYLKSKGYDALQRGDEIIVFDTERLTLAGPDRAI